MLAKLFLCVLPLLSGDPASNSILWHRDLDAARILAAEQSRPLMVVFS